jgi:hypothetical protein
VEQFRRSNDNARPSRDHGDNARRRVDACRNRAHFGVDVKEVEQAIVEQVRSERNQVDE